MKQKCIHCDGLGYFYNQATFQSEHCPYCEGKGYIEITNTPVETPTAPVVETPKPSKKSKQVIEEPVVETPIEPVIEPEVDVNSGGDVDGGK